MVNAGYEYRLVTNNLAGEDGLFVVNRAKLPETEHRTCVPNMRVQSACGELTVRRPTEVAGMCVYAYDLSTQELREMLGFDLFYKIVMFGITIKEGNQSCSTPVEQTDFAEIARMIYNTEDLDAKYDRLIQALKCLGEDVPDRLNAVLLEL